MDVFSPIKKYKSSPTTTNHREIIAHNKLFNACLKNDIYFLNLKLIVSSKI